jgi:hypothetical protein
LAASSADTLAAESLTVVFKVEMPLDSAFPVIKWCHSSWVSFVMLTAKALID